MKTIKIIIYFGLLIIFSVCLGVLGFLYYGVNVPVSDQTGVTQFNIEPKESRLRVAKNLQEKGLIKDYRIFVVYVFVKQSVVQTGSYKISPSYNIVKIADMFANTQIQENQITLIEGWSSWQIAQELAKMGYGDYNAILTQTKQQEGYLFPDTYRLAQNATLEEILNIFKQNYDLKTEDFSLTKDDLIIASLLEREGKTSEERKMIAGIIKNRINKGMTLDLDATIQYAKGSWGLISRADITNIVSEYNTYKNLGLPPTPICNPGLDSIESALAPTENQFYYYFHSRDGSIKYSKTLAEHNANIAKFGVSGS